MSAHVLHFKWATIATSIQMCGISFDPPMRAKIKYTVQVPMSAYQRDTIVACTDTTMNISLLAINNECT